MKRQLWLLAVALLTRGTLAAHCQMPCGIYHDDMVFGQVDQYIETMYKGMTVINDSAFATVKDRNETIRWVVLKENSSDAVAELIMTYFLQQKIKPGEADTPKRLALAHQLLFALVKIKQTADRQLVMEFSKLWDEFKGLFHIEGYACELEKRKLGQQNDADHTHDHDHDHDHDHTH